MNNDLPISKTVESSNVRAPPYTDVPLSLPNTIPKRDSGLPPSATSTP
jgi:hypothetical protein